MSHKKKTVPKKALPSKAQPKTKKKLELEQLQAGTSSHKEVYTILPDITLNARGRPKQKGDMKKITLTISHDQIIWLDRLATDIRAASRSIIDRGTIVRALISALENSGLNIKNCSKESEIQEIITRKLRSK